MTDSISKLTSLKYFNMFGNKLTSLPKGFPLNLTSLILRANLFKEFPKQIYQMKDLELLDPSKLKEDVLNQIKRLTIG